MVVLQRIESAQIWWGSKSSRSQFPTVRHTFSLFTTLHHLASATPQQHL